MTAAAMNTATPPTCSRPEQMDQKYSEVLEAKVKGRVPFVEIHPNSGQSVTDIEAIGDKAEPLISWQRRNRIDTGKQIKLVKLAHMRYQHPDLVTLAIFLRDFGMHVAQQSEDGSEMWFRGYGPDPYVYYARRGTRQFLGGTFEVESRHDLETATQLPGASEVIEMTDAPGGGHMVVLHDPDGFPINLMHGQVPTPVGDLPHRIILNDETDKPRVRKFNRFTPGPAAVHKLGHYGLCVQNFDKQLEWYTRVFNFAPTDFLYVSSIDKSVEGAETERNGADRESTKDIAVFMHIDRGSCPVDHHSFFMSTNPTRHVHHCSFEVHDYDTQQLGHQWLGKQGYSSVWGIGRHILGSQIFVCTAPEDTTRRRHTC